MFNSLRFICTIFLCSTAKFLFAQNCNAQVSLRINDNISCFNAADGELEATINGGTSPYGFYWIPSGQKSSIAKNLSSGWHQIRITDALGCVYKDSIELNQPKPLAINMDSTFNVTCNGGNNGYLAISAFGGTAPYSIIWESGFQGNARNGLKSDTFIIEVEDDNGCKEKKEFFVSQPDSVSIQKDVIKDVSCHGYSDGVISVFAKGGTGSYTYTWFPNVSTSHIATNLQSGTYRITVQDSFGCSAHVKTTLVQPESIKTEIDSISHVTCNGNQDAYCAVFSRGGTPSYFYNWSTGSNSNFENQLPAGNHFVITTDANNCYDTLKVEVDEPQKLKIQLNTISHITCYGENDGKASLGVTGGNGGYSYNWLQLPDYSLSKNDNLYPGNYSVQVLNEKGCVDSIGFLIRQADLFSAHVNTTNAKCFRSSNGTAIVKTDGGTFPYEYHLLASGSQPQNSNLFTGLDTGLYILEITDSNNCKTADTFTITEPPELSLEFSSIKNVTCKDWTDGHIHTTVNGGTQPYHFHWNNSDTTAKIDSLEDGLYRLSVKDKNGCKIDTSWTITEPDSIEVEILGERHSVDFGEGQLLSSFVKAPSRITYRWTPDTGVVCNNCPETHHVGLLDTTIIELYVETDLGCNARDTYKIVTNPEHKIFIANAFTPDGNGINDSLPIVTKGLKEYDLKLFNRWGQLVYEDSRESIKWQEFHVVPSIPEKASENMPAGEYLLVLNIKYHDNWQEFLKSKLIILK